jgi:hypothetical protein
LESPFKECTLFFIEMRGFYLKSNLLLYYPGNVTDSALEGAEHPGVSAWGVSIASCRFRLYRKGGTKLTLTNKFSLKESQLLLLVHSIYITVNLIKRIMKDKKFLIVARALVIYMIAALVIVSFAGTGAAVSLSNSGGGTWKYQREISIKENSGTTLTDYQVLIELKGADFPVEAKSDGADVRFTDSKGNELNYWIESWDYSGKSAKVWVKIPSISAGSSTVIRMHYGNSGASVISNGDKVFDFFDDFEYSDAVTNHGWGNTDTRCVLQTTSTDWATSGTRSMKIVHTIDVVCGIIRQIPIPTPFLITYDAKQTQSSTATIVVSSATASNWNAGTTPEFTFPYT